jgi:hypothetical protein
MLPAVCLKREFPLIISGYTVSSHLGSYYKRAARRLCNSLLKFDLPHIIYPLSAVKDWQTGCSFKTALILSTMKRFNHPILWIDADGEVFKFPALFEDAKFDFAVNIVGGGHWLSGTLYASMSALPLIEDWHKKTSPKEPDEITLANIFKNKRYRFRFRRLPMAYNYVVHQDTDLTNVIIGHYIRPDVAPSRKVKAVKI